MAWKRTRKSRRTFYSYRFRLHAKLQDLREAAIDRSEGPISYASDNLFNVVSSKLA
jgi:hypothetical protein